MIKLFDKAIKAKVKGGTKAALAMIKS